VDGLWGVASGGEVRQWDPCSAAAQVEERGHGGLTMLSVESFRKLRSWVEVRYRRRCMCYTGRGCFIPQMMAVAERLVGIAPDVISERRTVRRHLWP